ncbi:MAG: endonuclease VII domain-containing protein, partial [Clostridia bacterium]
KIAKTDFFPAKVSSDGYTVRCKSCHQAKNRDLKLKRHFNMSLEDYDSLYAQQNGVCAICGSPEVRQAKHQETYYLAVDHDHATEKVRGLLCSRCNKLLGVVNDDIDLCNAVINYLTYWKAKHNGT